MSRVQRAGGWFRRNWRRIAVVVLAIVLSLAGVFVWYFSNPHHVRDDQFERATERPDVNVSEAHGGYVIEPTDAPANESEVGLVFYPGGRVHPDAYVPSLAGVAARGNVTVFVPKLTLNLAVLDRNRAADVMDANPEIDRWYVGGHSLGGAMACRYANEAPGTVEGVVLFASYCDRNLSSTDLDVLSVTGAEDTVFDRDTYENRRDNLPSDAVHVELDGVNHSQFGGYVGQRGGQPSGTSFETAHERLADVVGGWFGNRTESADDETADLPARTARDDLLERAMARDDVTIRRDDGYVIEPADAPDGEPRVGMVFYTGGQVEPAAYVPSLAGVAARTNVTVFVPKFPGNLAVADSDRAGDVMDANPEIDRWYVGGHSLGGSMACRYANEAPGTVEGVVLFASYCDRDVSETGLAVLSVTGAEDTVLDRDSYEDARDNLPPDAVHVELDGVNHSQFGGYVDQPDGQSTGTSFETAHERLADVVGGWFGDRSGDRSGSERAASSDVVRTRDSPLAPQSSRSGGFLTLHCQARV